MDLSSPYCKISTKNFFLKPEICEIFMLTKRKFCCIIILLGLLIKNRIIHD